MSSPDPPYEEVPPDAIVVDVQGHIVTFTDSTGDRIQICFNADSDASSKAFMMVCAVAIIQSHHTDTGESAGWIGVGPDDLEIIRTQHLQAGFSTSAFLTYWRDYRDGRSANVPRVDIHRNGDSLKDDEQAGRATPLFQRHKGKLFLGERTLQGARHLYQQIEFANRTSAYNKLSEFINTHVWVSGHRGHVLAGSKSADLEALRQALSEDAERGMAGRLHGELDSYINLSVESLQTQLGAGFDTSGFDADSNGPTYPYEIGNAWVPFSKEQLTQPGASYAVSGVAGSGKTTFLRHLQIEVSRSSDRVPVFVSAGHVARLDLLRWPDLSTDIIQRLAPQADSSGLLEALRIAFTESRIVFLIDALDNLGAPGQDCREVVERLLEMAAGNAIIMAGRPTTVQSLRGLPRLNMLRLRALSLMDLEELFGSDLVAARDLCSCDLTMLRSPMLAYIVREVLGLPQYKAIRSRHDLYQEFVRHILYEHPSNRQLTGHREWASTVYRNLSKLSYSAIDREDPYFGYIPDSIVRYGEGVGPSADDIAASGIADILEPCSGGRTSCYVFSHQSLQEFFAAQWIAANPDLVDHVVMECWNPKWHIVLRFLAGALGEDFLTRLFSGRGKEDPIHVRLFLAAQCAGETHTSNEYEQTLLDAIASGPLTPHARFNGLGRSSVTCCLTGLTAGDSANASDPFILRSARALAGMRTEASLAAAWSLVQAADASNSNALSCDEEVIIPLYSDARLHEAFATLQDAEGALRCLPDRPSQRSQAYFKLSCWADIMPSRSVDEYATFLSSITYDGLVELDLPWDITAFARLVPRISTGTYHRLLDDAIASGHKTRLHVLLSFRASATINRGDLLAAVEIATSQLPGADDQREWPNPLYAVLRHSHYIPRERALRLIAQILRKYRWLTDVECWLVGSLILRSAPRHVERWIETVRSGAGKPVSRALQGLRTVANHLTKSHLDVIAACRPKYWEDVLAALSILPARTHRRADLVESIVEPLTGEKGYLHPQVSLNGDKWGKHATGRQIDAILQAPVMEQLGKRYVMMCLAMVDQLSTEQCDALAKLIMSSSDPFDRFGWARSSNALLSLSQRGSEETTRRAIDEIEKRIDVVTEDLNVEGEAASVISACVGLCDPLRLGSRGRGQLLKCMSYVAPDVKPVILQRLQMAHSYGWDDG